VLVVALLAGAGAIASRYRTGERSGSPLGRLSQARVVPPEPATAPLGSAAARRSDALSALLATRASAVLHRDRVRFLAGVDNALPAFRRSQERLFDALSGLRFSSWRYEIDAPAAGRRVPDPGRFRGAAEVYAPRGVVVLYQLAGYDTAPTSNQAALTFLRRGSSWRLAADSDFDRSANGTQREVWDYGPLITVSGSSALILGRPSARRLLVRLRAEAERDIPRVNAVWGLGWSRRVVIEVPGSQQELADILHRQFGSLSRIAAVATAELGGSGRDAAVGNRILVNPATASRLGALGQQVVITHEITHVATRAVTAAAAPTWLVEGFADFVAYRSAAVPVTVAARELRTAVRTGHVPSGLPTERDFNGTNPNLAQSYEEAWLAVRLIANRAGSAGLLRFYRAVAGASAADRAGALSAALAATLGDTSAGFTALWRRYLTTTLS
jgi:hypothetical protein